MAKGWGGVRGGSKFKSQGGKKKALLVRIRFLLIRKSCTIATLDKAKESGETWGNVLTSICA